MVMTGRFQFRSDAKMKKLGTLHKRLVHALRQPARNWISEMKSLCLTLLGASVLLWSATQVNGAHQNVLGAHGDWILDADPASHRLTVSHRQLGILLTNVQFSVQAAQKENPAEAWALEQGSGGRVLVRTSSPRTTWVLDFADSALRISCTAPSAVLRAQVPASENRVVARLLDPNGFPVEWAGTGEVADGYGGARTRNPSYLPHRNPDCMYFALGQVAGGLFHSLFDRATDTAIDFPEQARLDYSANSGLLDLRLAIAGSVQIRLTPDYFTKTLGVPFYTRFNGEAFPRPPAVWCSWTSYYGDVSEAAVVTNTEWLAENLKPYGFQYVQVDDGYDRGLKEGHYWVEHWDQGKFPHGPEWLASHIRSKGLHPGLWLVPNAYAGAVDSHPQWYLRDKQGGIVQDYGTPALDSSNPEVLDFLKGLFTTLRGWGFDYFKFDGEHALPRYVPAVDLQKLHDRSTDPVVAYRNRLEVIRQVIGPETFVEGCPAGTPLNGISFFNSYFNGQDVYNNWNGMHALFSSINANAFLNRMVVYVMPGEGMELGERLTVEQARQRRPAEVVETARSREDPMIGFGVTTAEARTLVSLVALSGVVYPLAGVMPELPADRLGLLQRTLPTMPIQPMDLFSRGTDIDWDTFKHTTSDDYIQHYPEILDLKVKAASGTYDVVALPNWRSAGVTKTISFADKLGLMPGANCIAFDFWNQKLLGVFQDRISLDIEGHDTRVILLHPFLRHPQLIGNSRHVSGSYSIRDLEWDSSQSILKGASETVAGRPYTLFLYVPESTRLVEAQAVAEDGRSIKTDCTRNGSLLAATFEQPTAIVQWQFRFKSARE